MTDTQSQRPNLIYILYDPPAECCIDISFVKVAELFWMFWPKNLWGPGNTGEDLEEVLTAVNGEPIGAERN
jgi:hypothetical protein